MRRAVPDVTHTTLKSLDSAAGAGGCGQDPATSPPVRRAALVTPGGPAIPLPPGMAGGTTSPPATPAPGGMAGASSSRPVVAPSLPGPDGMTDPVTGAAPLPPGVAPGRVPSTQTPAGGVGASPASPAGLQGTEWQKAVKAELSAQGRERRRRSHRYVPVAKRTAYRPGMAVKPPEKPQGET